MKKLVITIIAIAAIITTSAILFGSKGSTTVHSDSVDTLVRESELKVKEEDAVQETIIANILAKTTETTSTTIETSTTETTITEEVEETYEVTIIGCTVRTAYNTVSYTDSTSATTVATIPADTKLTVIAEESNMFQVTYNGEYVWINSTNVLVNIAQMIPSLDIRLAMAQETNLFQMADQAIDGLTDKQFYTASGSVNNTEAWLRYEPAKKLAAAQEMFLADGYCIVVYDTYRPYSVTLEFQSAYRTFLNQQSESFKAEWFGELGESWFLAQKASAHNYGVAIDMSLKNVDTGEIVNMPSAMHTLDKRSALYIWENAGTEESEMALYLKEVMESIGFTSLKSEWWHFQDNSISRDVVIDIPN